MITNPAYSSDLLEEQHRLLEIRRMRYFATALLFFMLLIFIVTSIMQNEFPWMSYLRAFSEAAMVGACADWFAVVALFRHPLGIPIPHTAIIPHHKKRIGENIGHFISHNFLAPREVTKKLKTVDATDWIIRWLKEPNNAKLVANRLQNIFPLIFDLLHEERVRAFSRKVLRKGIDSIAVAPLAARMLSILVVRGYHDKVFDLLIDKIAEFTKEHRGNIQQRVAKNSSRWVPGWVDSKVTDAFLAELLTTLNETLATNHPWRVEYHAWINRLLIRLSDDPDMFEQCEQIKAEVLDNSVIESYLVWIGEEISNKVNTEFGDTEGAFLNKIEPTILALANWLDKEHGVRRLVNRWVQQIVFNTIVPNNKEIGSFVTEVIAGWNATTLVDKFEYQVGKDLQFIRINGTLVGGFVGLIIFVVAQIFA